MTFKISEEKVPFITGNNWLDIALTSFDFPQDGDTFQYILEMNSQSIANKSGFSLIFPKQIKIENFKKYLLSWPEMTEKELKDINDKREQFNKWI